MAAPIMKSKDLKFDVSLHGDPAQPCVISIVGTGASMNMMMPIVESLAARDLFVINYNPRDVCGTEIFRQMEAMVPEGRNLMEEMGKIFSADGSMNLDSDFYAPYNWYDLADDVVAIMDLHNIAKASVIGFSTGGVIAQVVMCQLKEDRLNSAVICSSSCEVLPSQAPFENPALQELMAAAAAVSPESSKEERVKGLLPSQMSMWEVAEGDPWQAILTKAIEDDYDKGWMDIYGGMNPFSTLAWASFAKSHEQHISSLEQNKVPCLVVAGRKDPLVPYAQSEMLAAKTGRAVLESHDFGHILGPASNRSVLLDTMADFIKTNSKSWAKCCYVAVDPNWFGHSHSTSLTSTSKGRLEDWLVWCTANLHPFGIQHPALGFHCHGDVIGTLMPSSWSRGHISSKKSRCWWSEKPPQKIGR